jgi:hypothetical protein
MSEWGKGVLNNNIGWGQGFNNTINWGAIYASSYRGQTVISEILNLQSIIDNFKIRVANDGGTFEAESNLLSILTSVNDTVGLSKINMLLTPNAFKTGKAYNVIGATDFAMLRNTDATRVKSNGLIEVQGSNIMRIDYTSGTPVILDELQATNLFTFSEDYGNSVYIKEGNISTAPTVTINNSLSPRGLTEASRIQFPLVSATNSYSLVYRIIGSLSGNHNTFVYLKGNVGSESIFLFVISGGVRTTLTCSLTTSWQKFELPFTGTGSSFWQIGVDLRSNSGQSSRPAQTIYVWGTQLTLGALSSSHIPTTSAAVTRNDDLLTVTPPAGTVKITTTFLNNTTQVLNTIPATFTLPTGQIRQTVFQSSL